jgi:hypothetical protein
MRQHHGIHGACAGAADAFDVNAAVFQQRVQHALGEGAVRATALQRQIDQAMADSRKREYCIVGILHLPRVTNRKNCRLQTLPGRRCLESPALRYSMALRFALPSGSIAELPFF